MRKLNKILIVVLVLCLIVLGVGLFIHSYESEEIGYNNLGNIKKITYSYFGESDHKIAIVTGMHPRETLSIDVLEDLSMFYALFNNVEIVNYQVTVLKDPKDFVVGRNNGESLVYDFVVKDISKENFDLVIIGHDHEEGYGEGFYIATPSMDSPSILLAEKVMSELSDFNYYKRNTSSIPKSSSITKVNNPIVATGTPLFVYEIPEWLGFVEAFEKSYELIDASFRVLANK